MEGVAVEHHAARGGRPEPGHDAQERALAGSARSLDREEVSGRHLERHASERVHRNTPAAIGDAHVLEMYGWPSTSLRLRRRVGSLFDAAAQGSRLLLVGALYSHL